LAVKIILTAFYQSPLSMFLSLKTLILKGKVYLMGLCQEEKFPLFQVIPMKLW